MTKKQLGRPPKKPKDRLQKVIALRFTGAEYQQLVRIADELGLTVSAALRQATALLIKKEKRQ